MGTTDSVSNPVACLRSNCVLYRGPTFVDHKAQDANLNVMNRTFDGVTTDPCLLHCVRNPRRQSQSAHSGSKAEIHGSVASTQHL